MKHTFQPGDVVVTNFTGYQHWSLVSDRRCANGVYMLISATRRNGTVGEETYKEVTQGHHTYKVDGFNIQAGNLSTIHRARAFIGKWKYSVRDSNCQYFVNFIFYGEAKSDQVNNALVGAFCGGVLVALMFKNPRLGQLLLFSAIASGLFVHASRAKESIC